MRVLPDGAQMNVNNNHYVLTEITLLQNANIFERKIEAISIFLPIYEQWE